MSETVNQETNVTNETSATNTPKTEKLFTQEEVNGFFNKRYAEMMSQLEQFKDKAAKYDELEEANKSELQKAMERAEKLENELNGMKQAESIRSIREEVAKATGVPASLLTGADEETCKQQAEAIMKFAKPSGYPQIPDGGEVQQLNKNTTRDQFANWAEQKFK